jgi:signal transduction histidine kinase
MTAEYAETDLARLVRFVAGHFEVLSKERRVELRVDAPAYVVLGEVDPGKVERILLNLLSNAFKFTPVAVKQSVAHRSRWMRSSEPRSEWIDSFETSWT